MLIARMTLTALFVSGSFTAVSKPTFVPDPIHESWTPAAGTKSTLYDAADSYHSYDALKYSLDIAFDPAAGTLSGQNVVDFRVTGDSLHSLILDAVNMEIQEVKWHDGSPLFFVNDQRTLKISLPVELSKGATGRVRIRFSSTRPEALAVAGPDASRLDRSVSAYTYTQPDGTRRWFPCHDIPSDKTITRLSITLPRGYQAVSNGEEFKPQLRPDGRVSFSFDTKHQIATYLTSVVLGSMNSEQIGMWRNVPLLISGPSYLMPALRKDTLRTAQMMRVFEAFTQAPYAFNKYRQTVAEGYGASMEHQSATTMGGRRIVGDRSGESVVAHELAHQWFGDLVTCGVWGDMWLNEGFASYLPLVFFDSVGDTDDSVLGLIGQRDWYFSSTNTGNARPLSTPEEFPNYDIFDQHSYAKGSLVIHLMRHAANRMLPKGSGPEVFSKALGLYLREHAYGNVRYTDLKQALTRTTGQSWDRFYKEWVLQAGHPQVTASWEWANKTLRVSLIQEQVTRAERPWQVFSFPLAIAIVAEDGTSQIQWTEITDKTQDIAINFDKPVKAIVLDPMMIVPGEFTVSQNLAAWRDAYFTLQAPLTQAVVLDAMFKQFDDASLQAFVGEAVQRSLTPSGLALIARELNGRPGLINEAQRLTTSAVRANASPVLRGVFAGLDTWIVETLPEGERPTFASLKNQWSLASRVEEREFLLNAMARVDLIQTQRLAVQELKQPRWTDRDRVAFVSVVSKVVTSTTKPFVLNFLAQNLATFVRTPFMDNLLAQKYAEPEVLPIAKEGALTHRSSSMRVKYVKLIGLQTAQAKVACEALTMISLDTVARGTMDDQRNVLPAVTAAEESLGCREAF